MLKATKNNRVYLCSLRGTFYVCVQTSNCTAFHLFLKLVSFEAQKEHFQKWYCVIKEGLHCLDGLLVCTCVTVFSHTGRFVIRLFNQGLLQRLNHSEFYFILFLMSSSFLNIYSETTTQHKIADFTHLKKIEHIKV